MNPPKAVIWDVGNVLLDWSPDRLYRRLIPDADERASFYARIGVDAMNLDGDRGSLQPCVEALADRRPADAALILPWWAGWAKMCGGLYAPVVTLRDAVRAGGAACWALTNFAADTWPLATALYPALEGFDGVVVSGREGTVKPEPRIYEITEARTGLSGADLMFIDDREYNIAAARDRGWRGVVFDANSDDAAALTSALKAEGVRIG